MTRSKQRTIGICFTGGPYSVLESTEYVRLAEEAGFDSAWSCDDIGGRDPFIPMTSWALATKRIQLGIAVTNPYTRHPVAIAATIATLDEAANGRTILGLGTGASWRSLISDRWVKRVATMRETIQVIRHLLHDNEALYRGITVSLRDSLWVWPDAQPASFRRDIPIYVGAGGPQMRRLTAREADGFVIAMGKFIPTIRAEIEEYRTAASAAGKDQTKQAVVALIMISVANSDEDLAVIRRIVAFQVHRLTEEDAAARDIELEPYREIRNVYDRHSGDTGIVKYGTEPAADEAAPLVTQRMLDAFAVTGNAERCIQGLDRYIDVGVTMPAVVPLGCDVRRVIEVGKAFRARA